MVLQMDLLLFMTATEMSYIEVDLKMGNPKENGFLQIQKIMKKQLNLIDISLFNFSNDNFLCQYHPIPFHFIVLIKFKK